jgi:hypothetical protein
MNNQTTRLSNRALREMQAKQLRSDAVNRFMAQCESEVALAKQDTKVYLGIAGFIILILLSAILGLN